jgi:hypothetical protein
LRYSIEPPQGAGENPTANKISVFFQKTTEKRGNHAEKGQKIDFRVPVKTRLAAGLRSALQSAFSVV